MEKMIAICGSNCFECPAYIATQNDDDNKREVIAAMWSKQYQSDIKPEDINCVGCTSGSDRLFGYCHVCEIRKCGMEREVENCAYCAEYACEKISKFFEVAPEAKTSIDAIRSSL